MSEGTRYLSRYRSRPGRGALLPVGWVGLTALVAALPTLGLSHYWARQVLLVAVMALLISSLNLSLGWAGEFNMGLPALYGAGAYVSAYFATRFVDDLALCLLLAALAAVVVGLLAGAPGLKLGGWMLAVCTFLLVTLIPVTLQIIPSSVLGGQSGFTGIPRAKLLGTRLDRDSFFIAVIVVTSLWFAVYRNAVRSPFGNALLVLRHGPVLAPSLGLSPYRLKLTTYAFASLPAGVAGALYAFTDRFIAPEDLGLSLVLNVLVASIVAGRRSIYAIFVGAAFVQVVSSVSTSFGRYGDLSFGVFLVLGGLVFGGGVAELADRLLRRARRGRRAVSGSAASARPAAGPATSAGTSAGPVDHGSPELPTLGGADLRLEAVAKTFGGVAAVRGVSFTARAGQITALVGPNGSGKTTTLNLINGYLKPTSGRVLLADANLTGLAATRVARQGVARTFQTPAIPDGLTVLDVVASSRPRRVSLLSTILRLPPYRHAVAADRAAAARWLEIFGLAELAEEPAAEMALGTRRVIELARALCASPAVLLLDEAASGLDRAEVRELASVLRAVRAAGATVILVEHNFSLVRLLADHVVVLAGGSVLAEGEPRVIAEHPEVLERFLGSGAGVSGTTLAESVAGGEAARGAVTLVASPGPVAAPARARSEGDRP
jgi:branched-chain amino acid transport system permease protein